jgi:hypothetical protein
VGVTARVFPAFDGNSGRLVLVTADTEEIGSKPA